MKVEDLIAKLQTMNPKHHVIVKHGDYGYSVYSRLEEQKCDAEGHIGSGQYNVVVIETQT
jgi:hypothetical protein